MIDSGALAYTKYLIDPGYIYVTEEPTQISAVLGSSVAVCIYDRKRKIGGMNHFRFPSLPPKEKPTARFGDVSTHALVRMLLKEGSVSRNLEAQVFGGAHNSAVSGRNIGRENVSVARRILGAERVRIVAEDVEGEKGRKIVYNTSTNEIALLKVDRLRQSDWFPYREEE